MVQFLVDSPIWLKILLSLLSLPLICLLMGILVVLVDPSSFTASDNIMQLGALTTGAFTVIGIATVGISRLLAIWFGPVEPVIVVVIVLVLIFGGLFGLDWWEERRKGG